MLQGTTPQAQHQVEGGLLLDVVVGKGAPVLQLLAGKDEALLVRGDACAHAIGGQRSEYSAEGFVDMVGQRLG